MFIVDLFHFLTTVRCCDLTSEQTLFWTSLSFQITSDTKCLIFSATESCILLFFPSILIFKFTTQLNASDHEKANCLSITELICELPHIYLQTRTQQDQNWKSSVFCEPKWKRKQTKTHKLMGMCAHKQVFHETGKKGENMRKLYRSQKSFSYEIYAGTSKTVHKAFQQRGVSSIREFSIYSS